MQSRPGPASGFFLYPLAMRIPDSTLLSIAPTVAAALAEDVGSGDLTAELIDADAVVGASILAREPMTVAGQAWVDEVFRQLDPAVVIDWYIGDAETAEQEDVICKLVGPARSLLSGERTALNFLQTLSATATRTRRFVDRVDGTGTVILDTRKTIPGLRLAQKYAVTCGGGRNHRIGLFDAILIKENHIKAAGSIAAALRKAAAGGTGVPVEVEVENIDGLVEALDAGAERILLDNFGVAGLERAVETNRRYGDARATLEASGNVTLGNVREIAETGVDFISIGSLTKHIEAVDLTMLFRID